ncbi:TPA: hypothetical protein HA318_00735 [Candidatus Micrarchaeota archaeon]|nr:MAG: hypothetical protein AUJ65_00645 [Candidatus Micrarchaeota archaeon CG1_02_51_15]HII38514.1 hypothetical protein [Candidatus Micrarchaeota archaeon]
MESVSGVVEKVVGELEFLRLPFKYDLVNLSALARFIHSDVEKQVGKPVSIDAIAMAIRRSYRSFSKKREDSFAAFAARSKLILRAGFFVVHLRPVPKLYELLLDLEKSVNWAVGEKMYLMLRSDEITVAGSHKFLGEVLKLVEKGDVLEKREDVTTLTIFFDSGALEVPGLFNFFTEQLAASGVPILGGFSTYHILSFFLQDDDTVRAYNALNKAIRRIQQRGLGGGSA